MISRSRSLRLRLSSFLINATVMLAAFAVAGALAEMLVRSVRPQQLILIRPDIWQPVDTLGWVRRPHVAAQVNMGERLVHVFTDRDGYRVGRDGRTEGRLRVLLLGDSFMEALQVEYEESLAGLLEQSLSQRLDETVAVRNAAVGGWDPNQYLLQSRALMRRDSVDLVLVALFVGNDAVAERIDRFPPRQPAERNRFRLPRNLGRTELVRATLAPMNDILETRSHLFVLAKNRLQVLRMRLGLHPLYVPATFFRTEAASDRWSVTAEICRDIADLASRHGASALFVLIPMAFQVDSTVFLQYQRGFGIDPSTVDLEQPSRLLLEHLSAHGLNVMDALPAFRAGHANQKRLYGTVDRHLSAEGHELLAQLVTPPALALLAEKHAGTGVARALPR